MTPVDGGPPRPRRSALSPWPASGHEDARSLAGAATLTLVMLLAVGLTATRVRRAPTSPAPATREAVAYVLPTARPATPPVPPPAPVAERQPVAEPTTDAARERPSGRASAPVAAAPADSGGGRPSSERPAADRPGADLLRRAIGGVEPPPASALARLCAEFGALTRADSAGRAAAGCPAPTAAEVRAGRAALADANGRALADAMHRPLPPTNAERDAAGRAAAAARAERPPGVVAPPPAGAGVSLGVGLPGGGPSNASRRRDRILDADVTARLARIRADAERRARVRRDSTLAADSAAPRAP